jgi:hypothetical protein
MAQGTKMISYTYTILRYVHDPAAGEAINVGVLFYAPEARYVTFLRDTRYGHLNKLFAGFQFEEYSKFLNWFESAINRFQASLVQSENQLFALERLPEDAQTLARHLVPDAGLSFQFGSAGAGITRRIEPTAQSLFKRFVTSQRPSAEHRKRRDDDDVWSAYSSILSRHAITRVLKPHTITTSGFEIPFDHAFQNRKWHAIKPMSFDYQDVSSIRERAAEWMGYGVALKESPDFSRLYLLLGKPVLESHRRDYNRAKDYLAKMPIRPEIIEEDEAEDFANELADYMREHGVLPAELPASDAEKTSA